MAELDNNKKYAILGKYLNAYIDICNKYLKLKVKLREYFTSNQDREKLEKEIKEIINI